MRRKMENMPLPNLKRLVLHMSFRAEVEKKVLLKLTKSSITLTELILWRNDERYPCECLYAMLDDWSVEFSGLTCMKSHSQVFIIKDFKGGPTELAICSAVLQHSCHLQELILEADVFQDDSVFTEAKRDFEKIILASTSAIIKCHIGLSNGEHF